jgi:nifR3 family TIM-barrel protein
MAEASTFAPVRAADVEAGRASFAARLAREPFMLAPMAGVTDATYREIAREHGCPLCYSEMVSVAGLAHASAKTWELVDPAPGEPQIAVQLFGSRPEQFASGAAAVAERLGGRLALIDINMACPVPKVFKKGEGSALMLEPERAADCVVEALRGVAGAVPVTVKIRAGVVQGELLAPDFARRMEAAGAAGVAVHGRAAKQFYTGHADWSVVAAVVQAVQVPVVGSGDVYTPEDAVRMLKQTGCAGVFVARGSYGNPWIFERAYALRATGVLPEPPCVHERLETLRDHVRRSAARGGHLARLRPVTCWYIKGLPGAAQWRDRAMSCRSEDDYLVLIDAMEAAASEHGLV